jgi:Holliday junction resolvasome RuvABC endonuclease subunit
VIVLGIDCGFTLPGLAVVRYDDHRAPQLTFGCAVATTGVTAKKRKTQKLYKSEDDARRMLEISDAVAAVINEWRPALAVLELPSGGGRSSNAVKGMAIGASVAVVTCHRLDVPLAYVTAGASKKSTAEERHAQKESVLMHVRSTFPDYDGWPRMKKANKLDLNRCFAIADAASAVLTWHGRQDYGR